MERSLQQAKDDVNNLSEKLLSVQSGLITVVYILKTEVYHVFVFCVKTYVTYAKILYK